MTVLSIDELQAIVDEAFPDFDVPRVESLDGDTLVIAQPVSSRNSRPGGTLSGPTMMALADNSAWLIILAHIGPVLLAVTTSLHIDFLRKPEITDLMARARLIKLGRRLAVVDVELFSRGSSELVAKAQVTYSIPPRATS
ncbi:MAG TPA: PaaI family thioesterase [Acidimicrobiales bacterium]|nr:PaaI family thioesterase [Acidimicrobiales bacterium]